MPALSLPKTAPTVVGRPRIAGWLEYCSATPLRLVVAPAGSGKTTSAVAYARARTNDCAYLKVASGVPLSALLTQLGTLAGASTVRSYDALLARYAELPRTEFILDNVDSAGGEAREMLGRLYEDAPEQVTFIYLARSLGALGTGAGSSPGLIDVCDDTLFAFDESDVAALVGALGNAIDPAAGRRLIGATHGWALAIAGACRAAAAHRLPFDEALRYWRSTADGAIRDLIADALRGVPADVRAAFSQTLAGVIAPKPEWLAALRRYGLFVTLRDGRLVLNPLLRSDLPPSSDTPDAALEMFGRFTMSIDGCDVVWQRRRDRQIVAYLAMQPDGRASRADLIATFWPDGDPQLARQSLRTAFCTIRAAIGDCVGPANVERYFSADHIVELKLERMRISALRFTELYERGQAAEARDNRAVALEHYREAQRLYRAPFLAGEPPMSWAHAHEARFAQMRQRLAQQLGERRFAYAGATACEPRDVA